MFRRIPVCGLAILACWATAIAQGSAGPTFVVASIKPAKPMEPGRMMMGMNGGPGTSSPGQITVTNMNLRDLMANAFSVKSYQISGPDWIDSQRFDIIAKVPGDATKDDARVMMQNLLKERFGLTLHHDSKEMSMYALVVAKGGAKLKESDPAPAPAAGADGGPGGPDGPPTGPPPPPKIGKDGMPEMPPGMRRPGGMGMMMMPGRMRINGTAVPISRLVELLARQYDRPVVDETGLTKTYDITLDFAPEGMGKGMPMPPGGMLGGPPGGMAGGAPAGSGDAAPMRMPEGGEAPTLATALQEQLGLKLEPKKGPVDLLVIDHVERAPTEN
jgi:uncharacterized protein (TIGR03435 family)